MNNINKNKIIKVINNQEVVFDSPQEYEYYETVLLPKLNKGEITNLEFHPRYTLVEAFIHPYTKERYNEIVYTPDFRYLDTKTGITTVVEFKGYAKSDFLLRKVFFLSRYQNLDYKLVMYVNKDLGFVEVKKGISIKRLRKKNRKQKEYEKYLSLHGKDKYNKQEREFIANYNATHKHIRKRDYINLSEN